MNQEQQEPLAVSQFILVLQDNPATGELDVAGAQKPVAFDAGSPAHCVGKWIQDNLEAIVAAATQPAPEQQVITNERARTIIVDSQAVARLPAGG